MTKEELTKRLEAAEKQNLGLLDEIKNLKEQLAEMQDEPEIPDMPYFGDGEKYWFIYNDLSTTDANSRFCGGSTKCFNAFHTKETAQEFAKKCKLIAMMLHCKQYLCCDYKPDFNNGWSQKWTVVFNYNEGKFTVDFSRMREWSNIYFDTEENAQKAATWLNEHWRDTDEESV